MIRYLSTKYIHIISLSLQKKKPAMSSRLLLKNHVTNGAFDFFKWNELCIYFCSSLSYERTHCMLLEPRCHRIKLSFSSFLTTNKSPAVPQKNFPCSRVTN